MRFDGGYLLDKYIFHTAYIWNDFCVCVTGYVECQTDNQITLFGDYSVQFSNMEELNTRGGASEAAALQVTPRVSPLWLESK